MKKLYSKFVESRVKQYIASHEESQLRSGERSLLSLVRPGTIFWQPISAKAPAPAATRWIE